MIRNQPDWIMRMGMRLFRRAVVRTYPFHPLFLLENARRIRDAVSIPVIYIGGVVSAGDAENLIAGGFPMLQIGRSTVEYPDFVNRLASGATDTSTCDHCNRCIAAMDAGGVRCVTALERAATVD
jgi:2,4-dienoyl-CoA reductase-like NADH-dependent reductase (Old Yellow Enzyme family)